MKQIYKAKLISVPLADGLKWRPDARWIYQEKLDGAWCEKDFGNSVLVGELVRGLFTAFDVPIYQGQDVRRAALGERLDLLRGFDVPIVASGNGGEFLEALLRDGKEGAVAKRLDAPFSVDWFKCKRVETFDCVVIEKNSFGKQSVRLSLNGQECGWCSVFGRNFDAVQVGDVIEVAAFGLTAKGKIREPRFVRFRPDKSGDYSAK